MEKKRRVFIVAIAAVLLLAFAAVGTYARYQSTGKGDNSVTVAKWAVKVNETDITAPGETGFTANITWAGLDGNVVSGFIAPGMTGTTNVVVDPTGSQVAMNYWIGVDMNVINNPNIKLNGVTVGEEPLTLEPAEICSDGVSATEEACVAPYTWAVNPRAGMYRGTIALPEGATMTDAQKVTANVSVEWDDLNTSEANIADTGTGVAADGNAEDIDLKVIVEQKVD